jgi:DNA invertase Pin-like site-specific DNA recombinase
MLNAVDWHRIRTLEGLELAKARGVKLGGLRPNTAIRNDEARQKAQAGAERLRPILAALVAQGASLREMANALHSARITTKTGTPLSPSTVKLQLQRLGLGVKL